MCEYNVICMSGVCVWCTLCVACECVCVVCECGVVCMSSGYVVCSVCMSVVVCVVYFVCVLCMCGV